MTRPDRIRASSWLLGLMWALTAGCSAGDDPSDDAKQGEPKAVETWTEDGPATWGDGCNPLARAWDCLLPYPSDFLRQPDATMPSGARLVVPLAARPVAAKSGPVDLLAGGAVDGFSVLPQIAVRIPGGLDLTGVSGYGGDVAASMEPDHPTLLLDAETAEPVAHFAEVDPRPKAVDDRALVLRPLVPLAFGHRYVVALRGLKHPGGALVVAPAGFAALRDRQVGDNAELKRLLRYFDPKVFSVLEKAGVNRQDLTLAWDFTTGSFEQLTRDMRHMRSDALARMATTPPAITVTKVEDKPHPLVARRVTGTIEVPLYLDSALPGARLTRGDDGLPKAEKTAQVPFLAAISTAAMASATQGPVPVVQIGHGFFGNYDEVNGGSIRQVLHGLGAVGIAVDWWGLSKPDAPAIMVDIVERTSETLRFVDRLQQSMINTIAVAEAVGTTLGGTAAFQHGGASMLDPGRVHYHGSSLGHILGATYVALAPRVQKAAIGVGGAGFGVIMPRSLPFGPLLAIVDIQTKTRLESLKILLLMETGLAPIDPITWSRRTLEKTLTDCPSTRRMLMQISMRDTSVPNLAAHIQARGLGLALLQPAPRPIWGLADATSPHAGSALAEVDFGLEEPAALARPPTSDNGAHNDLRNLPTAIDQVIAFLKEGGDIVHTCEGVCDPQ